MLREAKEQVIEYFDNRYPKFDFPFIFKTILEKIKYEFKSAGVFLSKLEAILDNLLL